MNKANTKRKAYQAQLAHWQLLNDVCSAGDEAIKKAGVKYLPKPNPHDNSDENQSRYQQYVDRAVFYNATGRTLRGLVGTAFAKYPTLLLPSALDYLSDDADGAGVSLYQQSQKALSQTLKLGRHGLFVDYPKTGGEVSIAQKQAMYLRARIVSVKAEQIINWRTERIGGVVKLSLVVIEESKETPKEFETTTEKQYRVLSLDDSGYRVRIFDKDGEPTGEDYYPSDGSGKAWREIPFAFIGGENNDSEIDEPPMLDLAKLNLAHYRNSADYEDSVFFNGQAQPYISGLTEEWRDHLEENKVYAGSRTVMLLPEGGSYGYAQPQPNTLVKEAMNGKETQMIALGARLIERGSGAKTATQILSEDSAAHSVLSLCANNVSDAYRLALKWCALFENATGEVDYEISQEYSLGGDMEAVIKGFMNGILSSQTVFEEFKRQGKIRPDADWETEQARLDAQNDQTAII